MATNNMSFVEVVFGYNDAWNWLNEKFFQYEEDWYEDWAIKLVEVKLMDSGGYRCGFILENKQRELFGVEGDA